MRLTLRTLLAYLDDVLEPAEAQDLGKRIQESEFAANLVHRIREAMRREKLGAPRLQGRAAGLDPNTVAEYLDNTLSSERVVDFEKYCLESEVHLAETACCHQVLALVLGEPALVDPDSRRRIYGLLAQYDAKLKSGMGSAAASASLAGVPTTGNPLLAGNGSPGMPLEAQLSSLGSSPPMALRRRAEVPDYLRQEALGLSAWWKLAAAIVVIMLLAGAGIMAVGPLWWNRQGASPEGSSGLTQNDLSAADSGDARAADSAAEQAAKTAGDTPSAADAQKQPAPDDKNGAAHKQPTIVIELPRKVGPMGSVEPLPPPIEVDLPPKEAPKKSGTPKAGSPAEAAIIGQLTLSERKSVLFRFDRSSGKWSRLSAPAALSAGEVLLCPAGCRNTLMLRGDLQVQTVGETRLEFDASASSSPPAVHLHYGRLLLMTASDSGTSVPLKAGDRTAKITFTKPGAHLALEARLVRVPGSDPEKVRSRTVVDLFAIGTGGIVWDEGDGRPITVDAPGRRTIGLIEGEAQLEGPPTWLSPDPQSLAEQNEQRGLNMLEAQLQNKKALDLADELPEWIFAQQREVQSLAYRWLISIDEFDDAVRALGKSNNRESFFWARIIEHLRLAVARDPQTAAKVRRAIENVRGEKAAGLYRMLWGYSEQDLTTGEEAKRLVGYLDHEDLDYRVLASWCLGEISGAGIGFYRPDAPAEVRERDAFVREWKKKLEMGKVVPPKKKQ